METPADKAKREAAEKKAAADQAEKNAPSEPKLNPAETTQAPAQDAAKQKAEADRLEAEKAAKAEAERIANMDEIDVENEKSDRENAQNAAKAIVEAAYDKMFTVTASYPVTTPNEHIVFGFGGTRINLGDLRALFGQRRPS